MKLRKFGISLLVFSAFGVIIASSAFAVATTTDVKWYTGSGSGTELSGSAEVKAEQAVTGTISTKVSGQEVILHTTGTECVECKIENSGGSSVGSGKLKFTGVTVEKPAKCSTASSITTKALSITPDWMIGTTNYIKFVPSAGEETGWATFELTGSACILKTAIVPKGSVFVQTENATSVQATPQPVCSTVNINTTAGGTLHVGTEPAALELAANFFLSGSHAGQEFGTH